MNVKIVELLRRVIEASDSGSIAWSRDGDRLTYTTKGGVFLAVSVLDASMSRIVGEDPTYMFRMSFDDHKFQAKYLPWNHAEGYQIIASLYRAAVSTCLPVSEESDVPSVL